MLKQLPDIVGLANWAQVCRVREPSKGLTICNLWGARNRASPPAAPAPHTALSSLMSRSANLSSFTMSSYYNLYLCWHLAP